MDFFDILLASKLNRSGGGAVNSVNGQTGTVELTAEDVGALSYETLKPAVDTALAQAKESGEFDGKSAYAYARDGGYTGTEEQFAAKLAEETYSKSEIDSALGAYITDIDTLIGGDS